MAQGSGGLVKWLAPRALRRLPGLGAVTLATFSGILVDLLAPWPMKILVDNVLQGHALSPALTKLAVWVPAAGTREGLLGAAIGGTIAVFLLAWTIGLAKSYASVTFGRQMVFDLSADVFAHLQRLSLRFHRRSAIGDLMRRVTQDCGAASAIVKDALIPSVTSILTLVGMFAVMWALDSVLALLTLAVVPLMLLALRVYSRPMMEKSYAQQEAEGRIYALVERSLSAIHVVQAFAAEKDTERRFRRSRREILRAALDATHVQLKFKVLIGLATALGTAGILWVGGRHALDGTLTIGSLLVFLAYLRSFYAPLQTLAYAPSTIQNAAGSARRVIEILQKDPEVSESPRARERRIEEGHLRFENVTAGYETDRAVIRKLSADVRRGEMLAVIGRTGAGKTTLMSLVPRFLDPWEGRVTIDGIDARDFTLASLRRQVAVVSQDVFLFPRSVAENIAYGRPGAIREEIVEAARAAQADDFIRKLADGYDTILGERGATLSGGERQRISIARAFLTAAPILVLDEPTSALDVDKEALLVAALEKLRSGRTVVVIAHRLSTVQSATHVIVMEEGRIVERGSPSDLIALSGRYAKYHGLQFDIGVADDAEARVLT